MVRYRSRAAWDMEPRSASHCRWRPRVLPATQSRWDEMSDQSLNPTPDPLATPSADALERALPPEPAKLKIYLGAAPGVGKTYQMLEDAHLMRKQGIDVIIGFVEPHGRAETAA